MSIATTTKQKFRISAEPLDRVCADILRIFSATRSNAADESRFDWLYRKNPDGEAVLWTIRETATDEVAGFTACLPRRIIVEGEERRCWVGADFSILPKFRTLGLAMKLRRAAKEDVDAGKTDFLYAHPNDRMAVIHEKVGHAPIGKMVRYAKVLRTAPYLQSKLRGAAARVVGALADPMLRLVSKDFRHRMKHQLEFLLNARFDERFDRLFEEAAPTCRVVGVRDARYLNWRYADNPLCNTHALTASESKHKSLRGFLLFTVGENVGYVKDLFAPHDPAAAADLIAGLIRHARREKLNSLSFTALESCPVLPLLQDFGFQQRPGTSRMFGYAADTAALKSTVLDADAWFLTVGDRDV